MIIRNSSLEQGDSFAIRCDKKSQQSNVLAPDPRETMKRDLPNCLQPLLTKLINKPYIGELPRKGSAIKDVLKTIGALGCGVATSIFAIYQSGWCLGLLLVSWCLTVYGSRKLRLTIMHACSHKFVFLNKRKWNYRLGELISILTLTLNFTAYQRGHNGSHHSSKLMIPGDETYEYLINTVGFRLGMTVDEAWKHLWITLLSPKFYLSRFTSRLTATFLSDSSSHNLLSLTFWLSVLGEIALTNSWLVFLLAWVIPISIFFDASTLLRNCVEHRFSESSSIESSSTVSREMTAAIFCGEATPQFDFSASCLERLLSWTRWWLRLLFYHLPSRVLVLTGDSPCHDYHHHNVSVREWFDCIFARQKAVDAGEEYYESWGLLEAINETFKSLSLQTPIEEDSNNITT
jgi:hypothetical protein